MRCPEIVLAVLNNVVRADPLPALAYRALRDIRRVCTKEVSFLNALRSNLCLVAMAPKVQGLAHGLRQYLDVLNVRSHVRDSGAIDLVHQASGITKGDSSRGQEEGACPPPLRPRPVRTKPAPGPSALRRPSTRAAAGQLSLPPLLQG